MCLLLGSDCGVCCVCGVCCGCLCLVWLLVVVGGCCIFVSVFFVFFGVFVVFLLCVLCFSLLILCFVFCFVLV